MAKCFLSKNNLGHLQSPDQPSSNPIFKVAMALTGFIAVHLIMGTAANVKSNSVELIETSQIQTSTIHTPSMSHLDQRISPEPKSSGLEFTSTKIAFVPDDYDETSYGDNEAVTAVTDNQ